MPLARTDRAGIVEHVFASLRDGKGGWLVTANLDFLRRHARDPEARRLYAGANVCVADGMPLVWAARLQGDRLPERVAGSDLLLLLAERAEKERRSIYLLGGDPEANPRAVARLRARWPGLLIAGYSSPRVASPPSEAEIAALRDEVLRARPDLLFVGMGSPKQEQVIEALRDVLPSAWMIGVGISFSFVAGDVRRAPRWMQRVGLEWAWRMLQEPGRLVRRYLIDDLPFFFELIGRALLKRARRARPQRR
ncbi:MAG: N-acetylglucosaminyldiphosphoundecaprenol N-acetyl-beta-D-mannosaminyltransferase [Myxococcales bacterium]|jgi:N-acetylglucosaminyldiphosphoundecaprenol N-acetyl-beta-D-mannosaminyltransferase|nr:N-acetylglucosaminyldiphosphoundecaprenol N-acetyl-beta-D-mannosaminyltransferase [Myxococcales bacterium]